MTIWGNNDVTGFHSEYTRNTTGMKCKESRILESSNTTEILNNLNTELEAGIDLVQKVNVRNPEFLKAVIPLRF
jgi:hypothetical protein